MPKLSTPVSRIRRPVKPKEELTNPFITALSHQDNNQVLMKEASQLKEWPKFTGEGEYDHMSFIQTIDMLQEYYAIPDELITAGLHSLFEKYEKRWYYGIRQTNGKNTWYPCSTEEYINALEDIVTRTKIGRTWKKLDIKSPNKPFIKKVKSKEAFKTNASNNNEKRKCHKCGGIGHLANNYLNKAKINEIEETSNHNDKEEESDSEKETEGSETSESDEINIINAKIDNIDIIYEVLDVNSTLPQVGTSDTNLTNVQDAKLYRTKHEKRNGYIAGKSSISIVVVNNQEEKVNLDTGAYCTCVGKSYLKTNVPDWQENLIPIQGVRFSSASESMKPLGVIDLTLIFPHPLQCVRIKVEFVVMDNCTSNHFILGNYYLSIYGIDISNQKDRYFTIGDNKRQKFGFLNNKRKITVVKNEEKSPQMDFFITEQLKEAEFNHELTVKMKEKLIDLLFKYKNAFETDKEPLGAII
ncbi:hypothetical protein O181_068897 [Austropuccinia psidii MF-1]|uniref:CCHC-type domain-containing protein n=1 Tax=Austropuccinia psidii MF-1 TaxID=1389203 RepID=A0A9Q3I6R0_9BASI|nr:hypothetical protein [Austropuccinia psidii MF-1]